MQGCILTYIDLYWSIYIYIYWIYIVYIDLDLAQKSPIMPTSRVTDSHFLNHPMASLLRSNDQNQTLNPMRGYHNLEKLMLRGHRSDSTFIYHGHTGKVNMPNMLQHFFRLWLWILMLRFLSRSAQLLRRASVSCSEGLIKAKRRKQRIT